MSAQAARPATLAEWLQRVEGLHPKTIELGLDRVREVAQRMGLALSCPVITDSPTAIPLSCSAT